jgi:hypothetical protein
MSDARNVKYNPEFNRKLNLNFRCHNVKFGRNSSETDNRIGLKPGGEKRSATTSSGVTKNKGVTTNKGAPGNWSASASGNAPCWNASVEYTVPIRTLIEITITTAITITGMVTTATAARNREATVTG